MENRNLEHEQLKQDLAKLDLSREEQLEQEVTALKMQNEELRKEYNEYLVLIQEEVLPKYDNYRKIFKESDRELEKQKSANRAIINFIFENGLGNQYSKKFLKEFYPHDALDFEALNELRFAESTEGTVLDQIRYQIEKGYNQN